MRYADHTILFDDGHVLAAVLTERRVAEVFGIRCRIVDLGERDGPVRVTLPS